MAARLVVAVCDSARQDPAGPATARAVTAARQAIGFTGFMQDNSTCRDALKIRSAPERLVLRFKNALTYRLQPRSADFQSAVSQNCILLSARRCGAPTGIRCPADYKSAIQQIENLRYECGSTTGWSHEYVSEFAKQATLPSHVETLAGQPLCLILRHR
jgi:hypothetical protein